MGLVIRQSIKGTIVNYLGVAIGFLTTFFIITAYLTQEEVGLTRVLIDTAILFSSFAQLGTSSSIIRFFPFFKDEKSNHHGFFFWTLVIPIVGFFIFCLVEKIFHGVIVTTFSKNSSLFVQYYKYVFPLSLFMLYQLVFEANANVLMRIVVPKFVREVGVRLGILIGYLLYGYFHLIDLNGLIILFCAIYFLAALVDFFYLFYLDKISLKPDFSILTKPLLKDILFYTIFLFLNAITVSVMPLLNTFFVSAGMGLSFTGIYTIANYVATVVNIPNRSLNAIVQPNISESIKNGDFQRAENICKSVSLHLMLSSALIFIFIWINIDVLFQILPNGANYEVGKSVVLILGISNFINSTLFVSSSILNYSKHYYWSLFFTILLTTLAIVLNLVLITNFGINGAALSNLISYIFFYVSLLFVVKFKLNIQIFSKAQLKIIALIIILLVSNYTWAHLVSQNLSNLPLNGLYVNIIDAFVKSLLLAAIALTITYKWNISLDVNRLIEKTLRIKNDNKNC